MYQPDQILPEKSMGKLSRNLRYIIFSAYRRLFTTVFLCNLIAITVLGTTDRLVGTEHIPMTTVAVSANLFVATAVRQEYIINIIFRTCWLIPISAPLRIRRTLAKCYEYGGVHSGAAISATMWFVLMTGNIIRSFVRREMNSVLIVITTSLLMAILATIISFAHPRVRTALHDTFERTHRWAGWATIAIFWVEIVVLTWEIHGRPHGTAFAEVLSKQPSFWLLFLNTCHAIHPWLRLRKWTFEHEKLSSHAVKLTFSRKIRNFSGIAISDSPLSEWHPFATFPRDDGKQGASLIISNAGDFTNDLIQETKRQYWVKGLPRHGPMSMAQIFRSVIFVTTGSGIGPCLTFLADQSRKHPVRILWSASRPVETFGENICQKVKSIDAKAVIIDTRVQGRPDLPLMAFQLYKEANAEAVFVLSNGKLTKKVKYAMESRGIPAYGPIFDS
jgi:predicted ferric reductase